MKTFDQIREGFVSAAQRKAVWASKADGGKGHPDNKKKKKEDTSDSVKELDTSTLVSYRKKANKQRYSNNISKRTQRTDGVDKANKKLRARNIDKFGKHSPKGVDKMGNPKEDSSDAVKAFLAKGGKIKKLPPAKAQGYHGKDDPGKGMAGMMDKPDTKAMGTRKKVKSMESLWDNIRKRRAAGKPKLKPGDKNYPKTLKINDDVKYPHMMYDPKTGNEVTAKTPMDHNKYAKMGYTHEKPKIKENFQVQKYTDGKKDGPAKSFGGNLKKATAHARKMGGDHRVHKEMMSTSKGPFGINPKVGVKVMKKGKEVPPTPPKIGVVSYTGGKKDKPNEGYKSYAQQKAVWASRADAKKGKK